MIQGLPARVPQSTGEVRVDRSNGDFVVRVRDERQGFAPGMRVEIFPSTADSQGRRLERAPFGPYRIVDCTSLVAHGAAKLDVTLRKLRRA